jgi:hypothetical protein
MSTVGNILIIVAQLIVAVQMVVEEKLIGGYDVPALQVVGLEGLFGFLMLSTVLVIMYWVPPPAFLIPTCMQIGTGSNPPLVPTPDDYKHKLEDTLDGFVMFKNNPLILAAVIGNILSIAFFNYFGASWLRRRCGCADVSTSFVCHSICMHFLPPSTPFLSLQACPSPST